MNRLVSFLFNLTYCATILFSWYTWYLVMRVRGIYMGELPESGRDKLEYYSAHPLMGFLNMFMMSLGVAILDFFCLIGMGKDLKSQSTWISWINMSIVLSANCCMLYVVEWATPPQA